MQKKLAERRQDLRTPAAYPVQVATSGGRKIASGRTADISPGGTHAIVRGAPIHVGQHVQIRLALPTTAVVAGGDRREVAYRARVIHARQLGEFQSVRLRFEEKLS